MRVALRRLRAAISLFKDAAADPQASSVKAELAWISDQLGPARDYEVFVSDVKALRPSDQEPAAALLELASVLQTRRDEALVDAKEAVQSVRYRRALDTTAQWLQSGAWRRHAEPGRRPRGDRRLLPFARRLLTRRVEKLVRKLHRLDELDAERRHRVRIAVKKLHYGVQFFEGLFPSHPRRRRRFMKQLKQLQDALGKLNDISVRARLLRPLVGAQVTADAQASAAGVGTRAAHALALLASRQESDVGPLTHAASKGGARLAKLDYFWA